MPGTYTEWNEQDQIDFVKQLQQCPTRAVNAFVKTDATKRLHLSPKRAWTCKNILSFLDARSCAAEHVSREWNKGHSEGTWKKLIERKVIKTAYGGTQTKRMEPVLFKPKPGSTLVRSMGSSIPPSSRYVETIEDNWRCGKHILQRIIAASKNSKGEYTVSTMTLDCGGLPRQYD